VVGRGADADDAAVAGSAIVGQVDVVALDREVVTSELSER
jgi:hypothetical protein